MGRLIWTELAVEDVIEVTAYVAKDSPSYARKLARRLMQEPKVLKRHPRFGWKVPEFDLEHIREIFVHPYRLIYTTRGDDCYVVAIVHGSRDVTKTLNPATIPLPEE